jgi:hypothetical protein
MPAQCSTTPRGNRLISRCRGIASRAECATKIRPPAPKAYDANPAPEHDLGVGLPSGTRRGDFLRSAAIAATARLKDGLDVLLRAVLWPGMLQHRFGHLAVALPFMGLFVHLTVWYVFVRTRSLARGAIAASSLLAAASSPVRTLGSRTTERTDSRAGCSGARRWRGSWRIRGAGQHGRQLGAE